jgi:putative Ca2+/H+ antiporter (TMEM165/GDT1 family)
MHMFGGVASTASAFFVAYWTVLVAELVGDKLLYIMSSLASRFQPLRVLIGASLAFIVKMTVAVVFGTLLLRMSSRWTTLLSAAVFFSMAVFIFFKRPPQAHEGKPLASRSSEGITAAFVSLFFTEWGDPGQFSAAALAANLHHPVAILLGGTIALVTKAVVAIAVGWKLRQWVSEQWMRTIATASYSLLGLITLYEAIL